MEFFTAQEQGKLKEILSKSSQLQTADNRINFIISCGLHIYLKSIQIDKVFDIFFTSLIAVFCTKLIKTENGEEKLALVIFLEYFIQLESTLSTEDKDSIQYLIQKCDKKTFLTNNSQPQQETDREKEPSAKKFKDLLFQIDEAEKAHNFQSVIDLGTRILEINVQHQPTRSQTATAYRLRGISSYDRSEYDKAVEDFNRAIDLNPEKADSYYQRARAYHKKSDWDRVIVDCDRAIKLKQEADYYYQRGRAYHNKGDYDQAITDFKLAIQIDRKKADYHYLQGFSLYAKGNSLILPPKSNYDQAFREYDRAIESLNEAIRLNPDKVANYYWVRGLCRLNRFKYDQAINDFNRANQLDPNQTTYDYNFLLGISYAGKHDYTQAINYLFLAIGFLNKSTNANYYYQRSLCYYNRRQNGQGNNHDFLNLLKTDWQHILSNSQKSDDQNALEDINRAIELDQFNGEYLRLKNRIEDRFLRGR